ncbi:unnamed protein product [Oppiella nova]|uniref:Uncharacterized protein n=1 Tax=Oppiella nova TaxID=334625 RepID=A0A7R9QL64_9ACAR|nr:unnamed protein product [Oppiella nova]CAG2167192.1 unnamed protein product [Oppiella nova]
MIIMNGLGFAWILFLHWDIKRYKRWAVQYLNSNQGTGSDECDGSGVRSDSLTHRMSITTLVVFNSLENSKPGHVVDMFCFGSIVHMGVQVFSQTYFYINDSPRCQDFLTIFCLSIRIVFSFYQLYIAFKYSNILIYRHQLLARFALMHLLATSLSSWFRTIISEAVDDYVESIHALNHTLNTSQNYFHSMIEHEIHCLERTVINDKSMQTLPYLYPFTIEFNIIMASIWYICWTNIGKVHSHPGPAHIKVKPNLSDGDQEFEYRSAISISADCHASNRGLFAGITTLLATAVTIIIFFATQSYDRFGISVYCTQIGVLTLVCCIVIPLAYHQTRKLNVVTREHFNCNHTVMDDLLVLIPVPFFLLHYVYLIMADIHDESSPVNVFLIVIYVLTILQVLIQSPFIVDGIRRCSNTKELRYVKPGRNYIMFALILNITLWILNTFELRYVDRTDTRL